METIDANVLNTRVYSEGVIRHLLRDPTVFEVAKRAKLKPQHFSVGDSYTNIVAETLVDIALQLGRFAAPPFSFGLICGSLGERINKQQFPEAHADEALRIITESYNTPLETEYYSNTLREFLRLRRTSQVLADNMQNPLKMAEEMQKIQLEFDDKQDALATKAQTVRPFRKLIKKPIYSLVPTGFGKIDTAIGGLGYGEYGLIIGYSGGGKTAFGTNLCGNAAASGLKASFLSLEETVENAANRFYSRFFRVPYTNLHNGSGYMDLESRFELDRNTDLRNRLDDNLVIEGLKEVAPLTPRDLYSVLLKNYEATGFQPDIVVVDQLQFLTPVLTNSKSSPWEREKQVAKECDELSHMRIGGKLFALWVLHQAKGKNKKYFTSEEIDGFKGIIHTSDVVFGIGKEKPAATEYAIFSMKSRHSKNFELKYESELEYMNFLDKENTQLAKEGYSMNDANPMKNYVMEVK